MKLYKWGYGEGGGWCQELVLSVLLKRYKSVFAQGFA